MSAPPMTAAHVTADELATIALQRVDQAMLHVCMLGDLLSSDQRHQIRNDLTAVRGALLTLLQRDLLHERIPGGTP